MNKKNNTPKSISALILAGGKSERFGAPKVLQSFKNIPFLMRIVDALRQAEIQSIFLVLGHQADKIIKKLPKIEDLKIVFNEDYECGQFSSLQAGIRNLPADSLGCLVCLIDQPQIQSGVVQNILAESNLNLDKIIIPTFNNRGGHPVYIPNNLFQEIKNTSPKTSLRAVFLNHNDLIHRLTVENALILEDIDTPGDLKKVEKLFGTD